MKTCQETNASMEINNYNEWGQEVYREGERRGEVNNELEDTRCAFTAANKIETCCVNNARLASPGEVHLKCHLEKHKGGVNAMLVELEQMTKIIQTFLSCGEHT